MQYFCMKFTWYNEYLADTMKPFGVLPNRGYIFGLILLVPNMPKIAYTQEFHRSYSSFISKSPKTLVLLIFYQQESEDTMMTTKLNLFNSQFLRLSVIVCKFFLPHNAYEILRDILGHFESRYNVIQNGLGYIAKSHGILSVNKLGIL